MILLQSSYRHQRTSLGYWCPTSDKLAIKPNLIKTCTHHSMEIGRLSIERDQNVVAPNLQILIVKRLMNVTKKLDKRGK